MSLLQGTNVLCVVINVSLRPELYIWTCVSCQVSHVAHSRSYHRTGNTEFLRASQPGVSGPKHGACKTRGIELERSPGLCLALFK